ncbi:hypothetical protein WG947_01055 [Pontibacter sp. H259]|uniref:hypothetical protein n=1 Tax=Pontibacter sp. H259 TaxID=3133421 RepID=UPI0030BCC13B
MELYSDEIIFLDYIPEQDILTVALQEEREYPVAEVRKAFISIVSCIRENNISRLLLDFRRNTLDLSEADYKASIAQLAVGVLQTPLQKVARVGTSNPIRENKIVNTYEGIKGAVPFPIAVKMFYDKAEALEWLKLEV